MSISKDDLIKAIADAAGIKKTEATAAINALANTIEKQLKADGDITIPGVGKLKLSHRAEREGRNPHTGMAITIAARNSVKFTPAKALKDAVQ